MRESKGECGARLIAEQEAGRESVRAFCRRLGVGEKAFYWWRRRLRDDQGVQFAVVETGRKTAADREGEIELFFANGERLRIGRGVDGSTLRLVLDAVRA
jgi:transposase-like protein